MKGQNKYNRIMLVTALFIKTSLRVLDKLNIITPKTQKKKKRKSRLIYQRGSKQIKPVH